jgi:hypothetical protein
MKTLTLVFGVISTLAPVAAFAGDDVPTVVLPEPATLSLMAVGVAGAVIASRFRKKK